MADLTEGKESSLILKFALPMLMGNVFQQLYTIINSVIVGNYLGKTALAAVGASFPIIFMLISMLIGVATGSTIVIAQYFGAKDTEKVRSAIETMYIYLFWASIIISIIGIIFSEAIFRLTGLPEEVIPEAKTYFNIYIAGIIFAFGFNGTSAALRGLGDSKTPLYYLIASNIANIILDLLFILVLKMGVEGAALGSIISQGGAFLFMIFHLNRKDSLVKLQAFKLKFNKEIFFKSIKIGVPTGFQQTFVALGMVALYGIVNRFGTDVIAAYSVASRIDSFASLPAMNFGAALSAFVGQNLGANKLNRVKNGFKATLLMTTIISVSVSLITVIFGKHIMMLFTKDINVINIGYEYLVIVSSFYVVFSTMFIVGGVMRGAGDTLIPMFITLFALWIIRIPLAYILAPKIGEMGIWWAIPIGWFFGMSLSYIYYLTGRWKTKTVIKFSE
jgi:putative MATE family efflux protein